jgi:hypothetical protein
MPICFQLPDRLHPTLKTRSWPRVDVDSMEKSDYRILSDTRTHRSSDCLSGLGFVILHAMSILTPIEVSGGDKLELLQRLDRYRKWQSLDEKRYCLACGRLIEGHDVLIVGGTRGTGPLRLVCPTSGCHSIAMDWVIPTDAVLARIARIEEQEISPRRATPNRRGKFTKRLLKFAQQFRTAA